MLTTTRAAIALLASGMTVCGSTAAAPKSRFPLPAESELVARVQSVLPAGWVIQRTESKRVPPGWFSAQAVATVVTISDGHRDWTLSFVPLDWIGIQFEPTKQLVPDSPDAVSQDESYKLLHGWGRQAEWIWLRGLANSSASLVNGGHGWQQYYGDRLPVVEAEAARLLHEHCRDARERSEAADSLARLGVPAVTVFRTIAVDGVSRGRETAISALGELGVPGSMPALRAVLRDPDRDYDTDLARKYAVYVCRRLQVRDHGPDLHVALRIAQNDETAAAIVDEINRLRYAPAVPELRRWVRHCDNPHYVGAFAAALATMRAVEAIGDIGAAMTRSYDVPDSAVNRSNRPGQMATLAIQLHRLTGVWGETRDGVRAALVNRGAGSIAMYVENMSDKPVGYRAFDHKADGIWPRDARVAVDEVVVSPPPPEVNMISGRIPTIEPGTVAVFVFDLGRHLPVGAVHRVSGSWREIPANVITVDRRNESLDHAPAERAP